MENIAAAFFVFNNVCHVMRIRNRKAKKKTQTAYSDDAQPKRKLSVVQPENKFQIRSAAWFFHFHKMKILSFPPVLILHIRRFFFFASFSFSFHAFAGVVAVYSRDRHTNHPFRCANRWTKARKSEAAAITDIFFDRCYSSETSTVGQTKCARAKQRWGKLKIWTREEKRWRKSVSWK